MINKPYYLILILISLLACNETLSPDPASLGYDYFPLDTGVSRVYDVTRIEHKVDLTSDTSHYELMEVVGDTFLIGDEESYRLTRYVRATPADEWQVDSVWSARVNLYQAIVVENNIPIIKLSFPLAEDRRWDGNAMNARAYDEFKAVNLGMAFSVADEDYPETVELIKEDILDPTKTVSDNIHKEVYAKGVGMIYRIDIDRKYCPIGNCQEPGIIEFGLEFEYKLIDYQGLD